MIQKFNKVALITGANRGIGFEMSRQLAEKGIHVILSARDKSKVIEAVKSLSCEGVSVEPLIMDITSHEEIKLAVDYVDKKHSRLDILINNAAIRIEQYGRSPSEQPLDLWYETFATNLFGMVAVTNAMLPLIKKSPAGRIVNVSSLLGSISTHTDRNSYAYNPFFKSLPAYSASKSGVNSWTVHLAYELRDTDIKVNAAHPGYTKTDMNEGAGELDVKDGAKTCVCLALLNENGPTGGYFHMGNSIPW
ncbi:SDR family oxidoreductase [Xenorhabdus eapokensis]|uniref:3-oxoacyl-ACP reductase n=1 Tax=Xenorhabdus eapokensis TaxID=1873482 RepID=A0A1Q5TFQ9_9GAMM|nr:SDR family oxidoreductase [Xenorhabdus eapokensis]OKO99069.1 3-oxoacyl-ACP reductase [Xenorhabdus eapokensis]